VSGLVAGSSVADRQGFRLFDLGVAPLGFGWRAAVVWDVVGPLGPMLPRPGTEYDLFGKASVGRCRFMMEIVGCPVREVPS
jgi:hypothetical protein